jgi:YegS/Rv2252/BmrU family lipid kinase
VTRTEALTRSATVRAEQLADRLLTAQTPKLRMLVIVNPYATTVSDRLRNLVVYALQSRYEVDAMDTEKPGHATHICREAATEGYDVVVAFGGDGTVNEAANGLAGSDTPLTCLPGGATNVFHRAIGIPGDVVDATEHLLRLADDFEPRRVDLGRVNDRYFTFSSGIGLDASVVERVDAHPRMKARLGEYYYTWAAISTFNRKYLVKPPRVRLAVNGEQLDAVTVVVQNSDPYTYFGSRPIRVCADSSLNSGTLSVSALRRATLLELPTLLPRLFSGKPESVSKHRQIQPFANVNGALVESVDERPFPLQVDGDFIGEFSSVRYGIEPRALAVVG